MFQTTNQIGLQRATSCNYLESTEKKKIIYDILDMILPQRLGYKLKHPQQKNTKRSEQVVKAWKHIGKPSSITSQLLDDNHHHSHHINSEKL